MPIYTRTGDNGTTGLYSGQRVSKDSPIIEFVGSLDELNSLLGLCVASLQNEPEIDFTEECEVIEEIQKDLFVVSSVAVGVPNTFNTQKETENIENTIDEYEKMVKPLKNFILPGGSIPASNIHTARTLARSIEREAVSLKSESLNSFLPYLNRLSDLLFVMARYVNTKLGEKETIWKQ